MVAVEEYRVRVQQLLEESSEPGLPLQEEVETQLVIDTKRDHYQLIHVGWENGHRVYAPMIHIDIKGDKVWLQHNMTDQKIAEDLVALGIPKDRIVLGFQPPYARKYTEFAVN
ncbi:MAG: XisI protein [Caldilinea sp. CFX5]|nr:XisI protein [Caldilinea sp. CFX5]